ncbi:hypothetical protein HRbin34_00463 [bacterium HR34]|nr:hypothetical protein HRbin34_00463 [bacterium HR34]
MKKIIPFLAICFIVGMLVVPSFSNAGTYFVKDKSGNTYKVEYDGIVPCGKVVNIEGIGDKVINCQLCHLFVMIDGGLDLILTVLTPPIFVLVMVIGGAMIVFSAGNESYVSRGKDLIKSAVIGVAIMFAAFIIVEIAITALGFGKIEGAFNPADWFSVRCEIKI